MIQLDVRINHADGGEIGYYNSLDEMRLLGFIVDISQDNAHYIKEGGIFRINGRDHKVVQMTIKLYNEDIAMSEGGDATLFIHAVPMN